MMKKILFMVACISFSTITFAADNEKPQDNPGSPSLSQVEQPKKDDRTIASQKWNDELKPAVQQIGSTVAETSKEIANAITESKEVKGAVDGVKGFNERRKGWF